MDDTMRKIGRLLFAIPMGVFGLFHFLHGQAMAGMVPAFVPGGVLWVYITGLALIAAAVSIIMEKYDKIATQLLAVLLGIFILTIHLPGLGNAQTMQMSMVALLKDLALLGGALVISLGSKQ